MYYGERLNSISHLVGTVLALVALGALLALVALGALLALGIQTGDPKVIVGYSVFGVTLVLLYTMSTLYHSFSGSRLKKLFQVFDHISIYLLIAGTYTPFMLVSLGSHSALLILAAVWAMAFIGIASEFWLRGPVAKASQLLIYLGMGWACALDTPALKAALPPEGFWWLVAGGIAYTAGIVFYLLDKARWLNHAHGIWHFFVLAGSACHFIAVIAHVG